MGVNRKFLYWGVFFVALGAVMVAADLGRLDDTAVADALRLWPLAFVALGAGLVLRRTRFSLAGGMLAAAVPGLVLGGAFALGPRLGIDCGSGQPASFTPYGGTFSAGAHVDVTTSCGELSIATAPGSAWQLQAGNTANRAATVTSSASNLSISGERHGEWFGLPGGRDVWNLTLPTTPIDSLSLVVNAGEGHANLANAQIREVDITNNAAASTVDLSSATVSTVSATINAGALSMHLPSGQDISSTIHVNAGDLKVCTPPDGRVHVHRTGVLGATTYGGAAQGATDWTAGDTAIATHDAAFTVSVNVGSVDFNPIGGCK